MIEFLDSADHVLAVRLSDTITGADVKAIMHRLDGAMAAHEKLHVLVETRSIDGIKLSGLPSSAARAMPLMGNLYRFGRVAIVADQAWIRAGSRIKGALLPCISYRIFLPDQREQALAWVEAGADAATPVKPGGN